MTIQIGKSYTGDGSAVATVERIKDGVLWYSMSAGMIGEFDISVEHFAKWAQREVA